jgi:TRAP-type C4-dicarboxylate transport system permease large subunit
MLLVAFRFSGMFRLQAAFGILKTVPYSTAENYVLCVIPLFVFMGQLAFYSGLSEYFTPPHTEAGKAPRAAWRCDRRRLRRFAAICGSSSATAATMGTVALPEMIKIRL